MVLACLVWRLATLTNLMTGCEIKNPKRILIAKVGNSESRHTKSTINKIK